MWGFLLLCGLLVFAPEFAVAQDPKTEAGEPTAREGEQPMPNEIWWKWANFGILMVGLGYLIGRNAGPFFSERTAKIQSGIQEAAAMKADAGKRAADIAKRVSNLQAEVETLRQNGRASLAAERQRLDDETEMQVSRIRAQTEAEIASSAKQAAAELKAFSAQLALELAEHQIRGQMNAEVQHELARKFSDDLRRARMAADRRVN